MEAMTALDRDLVLDMRAAGSGAGPGAGVKRTEGVNFVSLKYYIGAPHVALPKPRLCACNALL